MAKFNPNFFTQWFEKPKVSVFNRSAEKSFDLKIGPLYPAYWDLCGFGDSHKGKSLHKMRLAPLLAPNFSDLNFQEHSAVVPLRVILPDYEDTFNYSKNIDGASLPSITPSELIAVYSRMAEYGISPIGSLFDFLGYPVFGDVYKALTTAFIDATYYVDDTDPESIYSWSYIPTVQEFLWATAESIFNYQHMNVVYRGVTADAYVIPFYAWLAIKSGNFEEFAEDSGFGSLSKNTLFVEYLRKFADSNGVVDETAYILNSGFDTTTEAYRQYQNFVFVKLLRVLFGLSASPFAGTKPFSLLPLMAYHRFVGDWNINSLYTDPETYIFEYVYNLRATMINQTSSMTEDFVRTAFLPAPRLWDNDFFTSLLPTSSAGDELTIPANATVIDLAKLASWQKLLLRLSFSKRYRDVVYNIFGIRPSDARLQQSSVLRSFTHNIGIGETIQTSETSASSVLGSFGGRGYSAGSTGKKGYHIFCEEPCVVLHFVSLVPNASYADSLHPLIHVDDILDFPIPGTDVLGNQPIYSDLVSGNPADDDVVLGYGRQYMEWIANYNTVHNNMKTSLDYWQLTRRFDSTPALNEDFLTIDENEDLDNIFSVADSSHAFLSIYYDCYVTRPIHRTVRIVI